MENQTPDVHAHRDVRAAFDADTPLNEEETESTPVEIRRIDALRIPVGTNLADAERWMIFATLDKCGGNKTRAAALLGVSLKTLYNRLNAYRAQGLAMDYEESGARDDSATGRSRGFDGRMTETQ